MLCNVWKLSVYAHRPRRLDARATHPGGMRENPAVAGPDRLTGLDASFLALEEGGAHMHVGSVLLFDGTRPAYDDFVAQLERRLALVPRYRQKLAYPPIVPSRPVWVDDPHF